MAPTPTSTARPCSSTSRSSSPPPTTSPARGLRLAELRLSLRLARRSRVRSPSWAGSGLPSPAALGARAARATPTRSPTTPPLPGSTTRTSPAGAALRTSSSTRGRGLPAAGDHPGQRGGRSGRPRSTTLADGGAEGSSTCRSRRREPCVSAERRHRRRLPHRHDRAEHTPYRPDSTSTPTATVFSIPGRSERRTGRRLPVCR